MIRSMVVTLLALTVIGCQSTDVSVRHYQLAQAPISSTIEQSSARLVIAPVLLVDFLKRPNILLKQQDNTVFVTKYHVWAEPLNKGIARAMVNHLNQSQTAMRADYGSFAKCSDADKCFKLTLLVEAFYPNDQSQVVFAGKYKVHHQGKTLLQQDFSLSSELSEDGYAHAVIKLQGLVHQLSSQIEQQIAPKA